MKNQDIHQRSAVTRSFPLSNTYNTVSVENTWETPTQQLWGSSHAPQMSMGAEFEIWTSTPSGSNEAAALFTHWIVFRKF